MASDKLRSTHTASRPFAFIDNQMDIYSARKLYKTFIAMNVNATDIERLT